MYHPHNTHSCLTHIIHTHVSPKYKFMYHPYFIPVFYTCILYLYFIPVLYTCILYLYPMTALHSNVFICARISLRSSSQSLSLLSLSSGMDSSLSNSFTEREVTIPLTLVINLKCSCGLYLVTCKL